MAAGDNSKLGLGAAHFGLGLLDARAAQPDAEVEAVLARAAQAGVTLIDSASAYGEAEATLGAVLPSPCPFRIVTRTAPGASAATVELGLRASLNMLWLPSVHAVMVPARDLVRAGGGALWARLRRLRDEGLCDKLGISVGGDDDALAIARQWAPDILQAPVSLLDQRLIHNGGLAGLADLGVEVHLRAIFLHGLLFLPVERMPGRLSGSAERLRRIRRELAEAGVDPLTAAVRFALDRAEASQVLVGVTGLAELDRVLGAACATVPDLDWAGMALDDPILLEAGRRAA
jgi:aryl-alcohol dehydrogenase-like predicted oxidoreductase